MRARWGYTEDMLILGVIPLILGFVFGIQLLWILGILLVIVGAVLWLMAGSVDFRRGTAILVLTPSASQKALSGSMEGAFCCNQNPGWHGRRPGYLQAYVRFGPGSLILSRVGISDDDESNRVVRLVLRRPAAAEQAEELAAVPRRFDKIFTKPYYAHQMRLAGRDWVYIAAKLDYKNGFAAERAVQNWLRKNVEGKHLPTTRAALQAEAVKLDLDRLDMLMSAYWDEAIGGDLDSAKYVLQVIAQRAKFIAPDTSAGAAVTNQFNTLVVGGTESKDTLVRCSRRGSH